MKSLVLKSLYLLFVPFGLLVLSYLLWLKIDADYALEPVISYFTYAVFLIAMTLSWWFNQSRVFFVSAILLTVQFFLVGYSPSEADPEVYSYVTYSLASLLLPLNMALLAFLREPGILTPPGKALMLFIAVQFLLPVYLLFEQPDPLASISTNAHLSVFFGWTPVPPLAALAFLMAFWALVGRAVLTNSWFDALWAGALLAVAVALHLNNHTMLPFFFAMAGVFLVVAVIHRAYTMAYLDELTGLPGRRALKDNMMGLSGNYVLAMVDVDNFKQFNDRYGHNVGDEALKFVASMLRYTSGGAKSFRYGGEEFTIVFPGKKADEAVPHLEKLREGIAKRAFILRGKDRPRKKPRKGSPPKGSNRKVFISVSIGVSEKTSEQKTAGDVLKAADAALYRAKKKGKNCISR